MRPLRSTFKHKPKKRVVSRSFRVPPAIDKMLDKAAAEKGWTKSHLIREILTNWGTYKQKLAAVKAETPEIPE